MSRSGPGQSVYTVVQTIYVDAIENVSPAYNATNSQMARIKVSCSKIKILLGPSPRLRSKKCPEMP